MCVCAYAHSEERVHFQLSHSAFKASSQMLLIWRRALKKPFSFWTQVSQCLPAGPDLPIGSIFWPLLYPKVNHFVHTHHPPSAKHLTPPRITHTCTYSTLILDPSGCVGYSDLLTQRFKMSFKPYSVLLRLILFSSIRLQGQFAPTADEQSIEDLNVKSRGPGGGQLPVHGVITGGAKPSGSTETHILPQSLHPHLPPHLPKLG